MLGAMRTGWIFGAFWLFAAVTAGCAALGGCAPKEAADPHAMLGEDAKYGASESSRANPGSPDARRTPGVPPKLATKAECEAAVRRIEELGLEMAVNEAPAEQRAELEARRKKELASEGFKKRLSDGTRNCLARETSGPMAQCVARAKSEMDIDRCGN
jgi:hypothetical protein